MQKQFTNPRLYCAGGDLKQEWFVYYSFRHPVTRKLKRFRVYEGLNSLNTENERKAVAASIIAEITEKLSCGWNPYTKTTYAAFTLQSAKAGVMAMVRHALALKAPRIGKKLTLKTYTNAVNTFTEWLIYSGKASTPLVAFTEDDATEFLEWLQYSKKRNATSRNKVRGFLGTMFNVLAKGLKKQGVIYENPFLLTARITENPIGRYPFKDEHIKLIENACAADPQLWLACLFVRFAMVRTTQELPALKMENIDAEKMKLTVPAEIAKNNKTQVVDLHPEIIAFMEKMGWLNAPPHYYIFGAGRCPGPKKYSQLTITIRFSEMRDRLGFDARHYSLYSFKHTGNAELHKRGVPLPKIRDQNRHCDIRVTDRYSKQYGFYDEKNVWT